MKPTIVVEHEGKKLSVLDIARMTGCKPTTIRSRIYAGWDTKRLLALKPESIVKFGNRGISKNEAEMDLNETPREKLPKCFLPLIGGYKKAKFGHYLRYNHRAAFDKWFEAEYVPSKQSQAA